MQTVLIVLATLAALTLLALYGVALVQWFLRRMFP